MEAFVWFCNPSQCNAIVTANAFNTILLVWTISVLLSTCSYYASTHIFTDQYVGDVVNITLATFAFPVFSLVFILGWSI